MCSALVLSTATSPRKELTATLEMREVFPYTSISKTIQHYLKHITMNLRVQSLLIFLTLLPALAMEAQGQQAFPTVIPPSPTSQEFQKYLGYPVSYATGVPEISIPLYTIKEGDLTIPISLSYHASGIKVTQPAYPFGYGWSLTPGLRISRTIMGKPDELYLSDVKDIPREEDVATTAYASTEYEMIYKLAKMAPPIDAIDNNLLEDGQRDIFTIHLPSRSTSFVFQRQNGMLSIINIPESPLKITIRGEGYSPLLGFDVVDENGITYVFGGTKRGDDTEKEMIESDDNNRIGWLLQKIVLPGYPAKEISFSYTSVNNSVDLPILYTDKIYTGDWKSFAECKNENKNSDASSVVCRYLGDVIYHCSSSSRVLQSISFPLGKLEFTYVGLSLTSLQVTNSQNRVVRDVDFDIDRGRLTHIRVVGEGDYSLSYNPMRFDNPYNQDYWGYYNNGNNNDNSLVPKMNISGEKIGHADRTPNAAAMQANMLEKITYPTGGHTSFTFEPNVSYDKPVGGLRIKEIRLYDNTTNQTITKSYRYGAGEAGSANVIARMDDSQFIDKIALFAESSSWDGMSLNYAFKMAEVTTGLSQSKLFHYFNTNTAVWYDEVAEYTGEGKTIYFYSYDPDELGVYSRYNDVELFVKSYNSLVAGTPNLSRVKYYKSSGNYYVPVKEIDYNYYRNNDMPEIRGLVVKPRVLVSTYDGSNNIGGPRGNNWWQHFPNPSAADPYTHGGIFPYTYYGYTIKRGINQLFNTVTREYTDQGTFNTSVDYTYDDEYPYNLVEKKETTSSGGTQSERYFYPNHPQVDVRKGMRDTLLAANRTTALVKKELLTNDLLNLSEFTEFRNFGNNVVKPTQQAIQVPGEAKDVRLTYHRYDSYGNPLELSKSADVHTSYLWGYKGSYPVAQVVGDSYNNLVGILSPAELNAIDGGTLDDSALGNVLAKLRAAYKNNPAVQIRTFTYRPLVGLTSETDLNGFTTYYEYDSVQRLWRVLDSDSNVLKQYQYYTTPWFTPPPGYYYYTITPVSGIPEKGSVTGGGTIHKGRKTTITATPEPGYVFDCWMEGGTRVSSSQSYTFIADRDRTLEARFSISDVTCRISYYATYNQQGQRVYAVEAKLDRQMDGISGCSIHIFGQLFVDGREPISIDLSISPGSTTGIQRWTRNESDGEILGVGIDETNPKTCSGTTVHYTVAPGVPPIYNLQLVADPVGRGLLYGGGAIEQNSRTTISAIPSDGYEFEKWTEEGLLASRNSTYEIIVVSDRTLTAHFTPLPYYAISPASSSPEKGSVAGGGAIQKGKSVTVTANPKPGYVFDCWTEGVTRVSGSQSYTFIADRDRTLVASFLNTSVTCRITYYTTYDPMQGQEMYVVKAELDTPLAGSTGCSIYISGQLFVDGREPISIDLSISPGWATGIQQWPRNESNGGIMGINIHEANPKTCNGTNINYLK